MEHGRSVVCVAALAGALLAAGCVSMAGVGGTSEYACKAQPGVRCESVSGTYQNAVKKNLPGQRPSQADQPYPGAGGAAERALQPVTFAPGVQIAPGLAAYRTETLRSAPRVLRLWIKPWEDADGDLVDQSYVYVEVDRGRWRIDHVRREQREAFAPVFAPRGAPAPAAAASGPTLRPSVGVPAVSGPLVAPAGPRPATEPDIDPFDAAEMAARDGTDADKP